jgi:hypothetical protein
MFLEIKICSKISAASMVYEKLSLRPLFSIKYSKIPHSILNYSFVIINILKLYYYFPANIKFFYALSVKLNLSKNKINIFFVPTLRTPPFCIFAINIAFLYNFRNTTMFHFIQKLGFCSPSDGVKDKSVSRLAEFSSHLEASSSHLIAI